MNMSNVEEEKFPFVVKGNSTGCLTRLYALGLIQPRDKIEVRHEKECFTTVGLDCTCNPTIVSNGKIIQEGTA